MICKRLNEFLELGLEDPGDPGGQSHCDALLERDVGRAIAGCLPLILPTDPRFVSVEELLELCDGFLLTGGRPNVHPEEYGEEPTEAHGEFDRNRDRLALPLIRACVVPAAETRGSEVFVIGELKQITDMEAVPADYNVSLLQQGQLPWLFLMACHFCDRLE